MIPSRDAGVLTNTRLSWRFYPFSGHVFFLSSIVVRHNLNPWTTDVSACSMRVTNFKNVFSLLSKCQGRRANGVENASGVGPRSISVVHFQVFAAARTTRLDHVRNSRIRVLLCVFPSRPKEYSGLIRRIPGVTAFVMRKELYSGIVNRWHSLAFTCCMEIRITHSTLYHGPSIGWGQGASLSG
jgi:hypothetical protein